MRLAKPCADVGLSTNRIERHCRFWAEPAGLEFEGTLDVAPGHVQYRFVANGSVIKVNHFVDALPEGPKSGYREVLIARAGLDCPVRLEDPDGARVCLVPPGFEGVRQIGVRLAVRDLANHRRFYSDALALSEERPGRFRAGETLFLLEADPRATDTPSPAGAGWRYVTFQVFDAQPEHARALAGGATEAKAPAILSNVARYAIVRDPDGNAIEISQRASIVGTLE